MGAVVLDAGALIGFSDPVDTHHSAAVAQLRKSTGAGDSLFVPASALSEYLVAPSRAGEDAVARALALVRRLGAQTIPVDDDVARDAAMLRARNLSLRLPEALVIATARVHRADVLVTTGRRWPSKRVLKFAGKLVVL